LFRKSILNTKYEYFQPKFITKSLVQRHGCVMASYNVSLLWIKPCKIQTGNEPPEIRQ